MDTNLNLQNPTFGSYKWTKTAKDRAAKVLTDRQFEVVSNSTSYPLGQVAVGFCYGQSPKLGRKRMFALLTEISPETGEVLKNVKRIIQQPFEGTYKFILRTIKTAEKQNESVQTYYQRISELQ
ncbi:hypothetical protein J6P92_04575 [bacterium]|nr:hypothetical protein [bacterium]